LILILVTGTISMICTSYTTIEVSFHTLGRPPIDDAIIGEVLLICGFIFNRRYFLKKQNAE